MKKNCLFNPPDGLFEKILCRIHKERQFLAIRRYAVFSSVVIVFVVLGTSASVLYMQNNNGKERRANANSLNSSLSLEDSKITEPPIQYPYFQTTYKTIFYTASAIK